MNKTVTMGISGFETILFLLTVALTAFSFIGQRTSPIQGVLHLALFAVFSVLLFSA
jgi:Ca2+:H+ antiporter